MQPQTSEPKKTNAANSGTEAFALDELREHVREIAADLNKVAERQARAARQFIEDGPDNLRTVIRRQPAVSVGVAALAGALIAVLAVPRKGAARPRTRWQDWSPVTRSDLYDFADNVQSSMTRSLNSVPLTSSLERLADAVTRVDNGAGISSAFDKIGTWLQQKTPKATAKKS